MNVFFNIDKPYGVTSNSVIQKIKRITGQKSAGHLGTLDPIATGVLPVATGKACRLFDYFLHKSKTYTASFIFGAESDTLDITGEVSHKDVRIPTLIELDNAVKNFIGRYNQVPPMYSAKHINGQKAYKLARKGVQFELKPKEIEIFSLKVLEQLKVNEFMLEITCSAGTYIRSLGKDLASSVSSCAIMSSIRRLQSGVFDISTAVSIEEIEKGYTKHVITIDDVLKHLPKLIVADELFAKLKNGVQLNLENMPKGQFTVYCQNHLFGIGTNVNGMLIIKPRVT